MEVLIYFSLGIAAILAIFVTVFLYYHKQTYAIWAVFFAVLFTTFAGCLQWQIWVWKQSDTETNKPTLEQPTFTEDIKQCVFYFGSNSETIPIDVLEKQPQKFLSVNGIAPVMYIKDHKFYVDVTVSDPDKLLPVQIKENSLSRSKFVKKPLFLA